VNSLSLWLDELGLGQYTATFADNDVDMETIRLLTERDLLELGLSLGHRKKLLKAIATLDEGTVVAQNMSAEVVRLVRATGTASASVEAGERRQLTVLFCDMVGFTELANRVDPEILQKIVRTYEDACAVCISRYDGYVFQRMGDGIVAFFGYPLAHEGEAERAIHAGLAIVESLSRLDVPAVDRLAVRIGIATGLVMVSSAEKGAVGEPMNLASRLQGIASINTLVVSEQVQRLAGGSFEYEDLGEQPIKGIVRPTRAYRVVGVSQAASRFEAAHGEASPTPLVGREHEIALLLERWALAQDGEGQVVLLSGEPGMGKSRILNALRERLERQGAQALRFQCSPYYVNSAFWPIIDHIERILKFARDESVESRLEKLEALIVKAYGLPSDDVRYVASMLSIPHEMRYGALSMSPQKLKDATMRALVDIMEAAAQRHPSVMLFEDAHWADPSMLEVLDQLIDRVRTMPLLIALTHRPEFQSRWSQHGHVVALNLSKLTRAQSSVIVSSLSDGKLLPANLLDQILAKTDGVPLFVEELTKSILESGELIDAGDRYAYAGTTHSISIPVTLRDSLMARLDRYTPAKEIAQIGAAIGREFSHELISALTPMPQVQLEDALTQLIESGLAFRRGTPPEATYLFKHALVQDAAYDSLLKSRRQELHGKIARVIEERLPKVAETEPEVLAHHWGAAGEYVRSIEYWERAGQQAAYRCAGTEAERHLRAGIALIGALPAGPDTMRREIGLQLALGRVLMANKGWASDDLEKAYVRAHLLCRACDATTELFPVMWGLWTYYLVRGALKESSNLAQQMLDLAEQHDNSLWLAGGHYAAGVSDYWIGNWATAGAELALCTRLCENYSHETRIALYGVDIGGVAAGLASNAAWVTGDYSERMLHFAQTYTSRADYVHPYSQTWAALSAALEYSYRLDAPRTYESACRALDLCERHGFAQERALATMMKTWADQDSARAESLLHEFNAAVSDWRSTGATLCRTWFGSALASMYLRSARFADAQQELTTALANLSESPEHAFAAELHRLQGDLILARDGTAAGIANAESCYQTARQIARRQQARTLELRAARRLAQVFLTQGRRSEGHGLLSEICGGFSTAANDEELDLARRMLREMSA